MTNVHCSFIHNGQKLQTIQMAINRPSIGEWINKMWYSHREIYSTIKEKKLLKQTTWMNHKIMQKQPDILGVTTNRYWVSL